LTALKKKFYWETFAGMDHIEGKSRGKEPVWRRGVVGN